MAPSGDTAIAQVHTGLDSSNKTLLKSEALYKVVLRTYSLSTRYVLHAFR
jgi:caffeoyl-CoA O-methyltransferase/tricin synthase